MQVCTAPRWKWHRGNSRLCAHPNCLPDMDRITAAPGEPLLGRDACASDRRPRRRSFVTLRRARLCPFYHCRSPHSFRRKDKWQGSPARRVRAFGGQPSPADPGLYHQRGDDRIRPQAAIASPSLNIGRSGACRPALRHPSLGVIVNAIVVTPAACRGHAPRRCCAGFHSSRRRSCRKKHSRNRTLGCRKALPRAWRIPGLRPRRSGP